jgi:hypothetical protein
VRFFFVFHSFISLLNFCEGRSERHHCGPILPADIHIYIPGTGRIREPGAGEPV